jgi:hypothetical protein
MTERNALLLNGMQDFGLLAFGQPVLQLVAFSTGIENCL